MPCIYTSPLFHLFMSGFTSFVNAMSIIKNAQAVGHNSCVTPYTTFVHRILCVLVEEGYIQGFKPFFIKKLGSVAQIELKYYNDKSKRKVEPAIQSLELLSTPARKHSFSYKNAPDSHSGLGTVVVSTPKGVMSIDKAIRIGLGGCLLLKVF